MEEYLEIIPTCIKCDVCRILCPELAIIEHDHTYAVESWSCTLCQLCIQICPVDAIKSKERASLG